MRKILALFKVAFCISLLSACKAPNPGSATNDVQSQGRQDSQQQNQLGSFPTTYDLQEFYEIARATYLKKVKTLGEKAFSDAELALMRKFSVKPEAANQTLEFVETMFELLESGRYEQKLKGVSRLNKVTRTAPKGLTNADLEDFFHIVKMSYFKRITKRPAPEMDARESAFFLRAQVNAKESNVAPDDVLLMASDLFDKIEGSK
jgi:hypothetical protein